MKGTTLPCRSRVAPARRLAGDPNHRNSISADLGLRPWEEVAAEFTRRTGIQITVKSCRATASNALRKIHSRMRRAG